MPGGWLWNLSENREHEETDHRFLHFLATQVDVTARNLIVEIGVTNSIPWHDEGLPPGTNIEQGVSGGPVYLVRAHGLEILTLVGIIYEYSKELEYVKARPLTLVDAHGRIRR